MKTLTLFLLFIAIAGYGYTHAYNNDQHTKYQYKDKSYTRNFDRARTITLDLSIKLKQPTIYAECPLTNKGKVVYRGCTFKPRTTNSISKRTTPDIEHVSPASWYYKKLSCYNTTDNPREDCLNLNINYSLYFTDLHNLHPSIPQINRDRKDFNWCENSGGAEYGDTDFLISFNKKCVEPSDDKKGDVARVMLYMNNNYDMEFDNKIVRMYQRWNKLDPVSDLERRRNNEIFKIQGNRNKYIN